jgi:glycopeptide antibiotics resistance protein
VALFVPLGLLGPVVFERWSWTFWLSMGFLVSFAVEFTQLVVLSARSASSSDVVANTLGAAGGVLAARLLRRAAENH